MLQAWSSDVSGDHAVASLKDSKNCLRKFRICPMIKNICIDALLVSASAHRV